MTARTSQTDLIIIGLHVTVKLSTPHELFRSLNCLGGGIKCAVFIERAACGG